MAGTIPDHERFNVGFELLDPDASRIRSAFEKPLPDSGLVDWRRQPGYVCAGSAALSGSVIFVGEQFTQETLEDKLTWMKGRQEYRSLFEPREVGATGLHTGTASIKRKEEGYPLFLGLDDDALVSLLGAMGQFSDAFHLGITNPGTSIRMGRVNINQPGGEGRVFKKGVPTTVTLGGITVLSLEYL